MCSGPVDHVHMHFKNMAKGMCTVARAHISDTLVHHRVCPHSEVFQCCAALYQLSKFSKNCKEQKALLVSDKSKSHNGTIVKGSHAIRQRV